MIQWLLIVYFAANADPNTKIIYVPPFKTEHACNEYVKHHTKDYPLNTTFECKPQHKE